ncbi:DUF3306 domain-containing protein [Shimia biformata]|uniref:DUF3306 domain-containing protein n=1 Tax=Shimia biformata TaxID=1294299 RepID=UPI0019522215|nr:DUF3306 domain-containing protein [Shimia biformata]
MNDFWSRRKAAVEAEAADAERVRLEVEQAAEEQALAERSDADLLAEAGLPDPDTLDSAEQVQEFLKSALPQRLKTRALRRLWGLNPVLANVDGLVDYGEDFTDAATVVENLQTVYQVGKGMLSAFVEDEPSETEPETEPEAEVEDATEADVPQEEAAPVLADTVTPDPDADAPAEAIPEPEFEGEPALPAVAAGRRMRFRFDTAEGLT